MRILVFTKKWDKLLGSIFTTFRKERLDKDWGLWEIVQIVYKPRSRNREIIGTATIIDKEPRYIQAYSDLTDEEAIVDGFNGRDEMLTWMIKTHSEVPYLMNKLTLAWELPK